ncbi:MAG: HEAT repeat domain-containing protein [Limisphaerales bacterium]
MRAKVVLSASVLALAVLLPALYFHFKPDSAPPTAPVAADDSAPPAGLPPILKRAAKDRSQDGLPAPSSNPSAVSHDDYVLERKSELTELGMNNDPASLKTILSELENPEPEIRQAALSATIQFGSQDAIPVLQNEMAYATDPQEKVDIKKAIDFLELPRLGEDQ